ncbi:type II TA system antitoxin MqsA family protein [Corallococcus interemptor]|uniref:type II TA system antitoxin MqsA family protein n=1 Tax=Corallococcus interemptor TaxID=2316720 RepID=UPI003CFF0990
MNKEYADKTLTSDAPTCAACGEPGLTQTKTTQQFPYGPEGKQVLLSAEVPTWHCPSCDFDFTDGDAEELRHEAICRHLGLLSPREIREIRSSYRMTQSEFAEETGFGEASIKRWELGLNTQNKSADKYLRLLREKRTTAGASVFAQKRHSSPEQGRSRKFKTNLPASAYFAASIFELRLPHA